MPHLCNGNFIFVVNASGMGSFLKFIGSSLQLQFSGIGWIINNKISGPGPTAYHAGNSWVGITKAQLGFTNQGWCDVVQ